MAQPDDPDKPAPRAGRVKHDASGRAVWEWAVDTGKHALDSTSRLLKRLEFPGLKLADSEPKPPPEEPPAASARESQPPSGPTFGGPREVDPMAHARKSFNPYDNRAPAKRAPAKPTPPRAVQKPAPPKPGLLARLFGRSGTRRP